jgi:hypothetical protein
MVNIAHGLIRHWNRSLDPKIKNSHGAPTAPAVSMICRFMIDVRICFCLYAEVGKGVENAKSVQEPQNHGNNHYNIQDVFD